MNITLATWNINSIRIRLHLIEQLISEAAPDILCLQETKVEDDKFPPEPLKVMGFKHCYFRGEKSYNGVAILSKLPLTNIFSEQWVGKNDSRHIAATLPNGTELHNFYIPAGGDIPDPKVNEKFDHKLRFVDEIAAWMQKHRQKKTPMILVGDLNIAPFEQDVWSHRQLLDVVSHTPIEVKKLTHMRESLNWIDVPRQFVPMEEKLYSWWSYRNRDWKKSNRGRRLDHVWVTSCHSEI
jgi:exodeoxyribonuclease-3